MFVKAEDKEVAGALYSKINDLRRDVLTKDWKKDKMLSMPGGRGYAYLSADKVKQNFAPLFAKHGLEVNFDFSDLEVRSEIGSMSQHWTIKLTVELIDTDTGAMDTSSSYGEAGDTGDKGVRKAQTCAIKSWFIAKFNICDGIDPDDAPGVTSRAYVPSNELPNAPNVVKTDEEVASKTLPKVAPPVVKAPAPKAPIAQIQADAMPYVPYTPTGPTANAIARIEKTWKERVESGDISEDEYDKMMFARKNVKNNLEASAFIREFRVG